MECTDVKERTKNKLRIKIFLLINIINPLYTRNTVNVTRNGKKKFSMPKNPLKPIYGQYVVGLEPFGTFKSGFGCYHSSILVLRVRKAVKMGNFAYFSFLDYQSSKSLFLWSRCVWMGSYEGDWSTLKP